VLDPFTGSATTLAVAKKLERDWMGFEISTEYVKQARKRLKSITPGDQLEGAPEPQVSAPATPKTAGRQRTKQKRKLPDNQLSLFSDDEPSSTSKE